MEVRKNNNMVRVGIVGMGIRGNLYTATLRDNPQAEVVGVCDTSAEALERALEKKYNTKTYIELSKMLDEVPLDCLIIALPDFLHIDALFQAAGRQINVLLEKPMATTLDEARTMVAAIRRSGIIFMPATNSISSVCPPTGKAWISTAAASLSGFVYHTPWMPPSWLKPISPRSRI